MVLSLSSKLNILLKLDEIHDINPLYRASKREINQGLKLEVDGKMSDVMGINLDESVLSNSLGDLSREKLIGRIKNGDKNTYVKAKYLYFGLPQGKEIAIEFWKALKKSYPRMFK